MVGQISRRALLLHGAENAIVWSLEEYRKRHKQAKEPKNLVALLIIQDEIYAGDRQHRDRLGGTRPYPLKPKDGPLTTTFIRFTFVFVKTEGKWLEACVHFSQLPIGA